MNELKNVLEKFHDFIKNLKNLALSNLTNLKISQEYLIQTVLKRKKDETISLATKGCKSQTD